MRGIIHADISKCLACRSCELACAVAHTKAGELMVALQQEKSDLAPRVTVVAAGEMAVPLQCRHCEDAPCVNVCPTGALTKPEPEGPVVFDLELCIGCKSCILVCPFGVISLTDDGKAIIKCDLCAERVEAGGQPACVEACPTGALTLEEVAEIAREVRARAAAQLAESMELPAGTKE
jgi:carbon-monoxide dehydrogenase iron sulfur subunit